MPATFPAPDASTAGGDRLLAAARSGDRQACRAIVVQHQGAVFAQLRGILHPSGQTAWAEDLAQETFLRAFRALDRFEGSAVRLRPWLVTIATRLALNELRRKRPAAILVDTVLDMHVSERGDPSFCANVVGQTVLDAIGELPPAFRAAFLLRELHGLDYGEIAEVLEVDLGTVKSRLSRARAKLRTVLDERGCRHE